MKAAQNTHTTNITTATLRTANDTGRNTKRA
jgi:hypothetical protein